MRVELYAQLGYCGTVRRRDAATQVQVQGTGLTLYQGRTTSGCKNRKNEMAKKELKPDRVISADPWFYQADALVLSMDLTAGGTWDQNAWTIKM